MLNLELIKTGEELTPSWIMDNITMPSHDDIATVAYELWVAGGCEDGSADQDWHEAERRLRKPKAMSQAV